MGDILINKSCNCKLMICRRFTHYIHRIQKCQEKILSRPFQWTLMFTRQNHQVSDLQCNTRLHLVKKRSSQQVCKPLKLKNYRFNYKTYYITCFSVYHNITLYSKGDRGSQAIDPQTNDSITPADDYVLQIEDDEAKEYKTDSDDAQSGQVPILSRVRKALKPPSK